MQAFPPSSPALRTQLETQVNFITQLSRHSVDALGQISELNLQAARQLLDDGIALGRSLVACKDPLQMVSVAMRETQPAAEHWRTWQSACLRVLSSSGATLARDTNESGWLAARGAASSMENAGQYGAAHNPT